MTTKRQGRKRLASNQKEVTIGFLLPEKIKKFSSADVLRKEVLSTVIRPRGRTFW